MKKLLSIIIAILMIVTTIPMAFAAEDCDHAFNTETLNRDTLEFTCSSCNEVVVCKSADYTELSTIGQLAYYMICDNKGTEGNSLEFYNEGVDDILERYPYLMDGEYTEYEQAEVDAAVDELLALAEEINDKFENGEYGIAINFYPFYSSYFEVFYCLAKNGIEGAAAVQYLKDFFSEEYILEKDALYSEYIGKMYEIQNAFVNGNGTAEAAAEFKEYAEKTGEIYKNMLNCLEDVHSFSYETTAPATCEADAIEVGTCTECGATTERTVEGSKLEHIDEDADNACDFGCGYDFEQPEKESCAICGAAAHEGPYGQYICMLTSLLKIVVALVKALGVIA